jgi:aspartokinase-like uncharacterized kinase
MTQLPLRVVKVGGSLFDFEGFIPALRDWLDSQSPAIHVLVAGGGKFSDAVRELDERFGIGLINSHWMCVRLLDCTARLMVLLLPEAELVTRFEELKKHCTHGREHLLAYSCEQFLQHHEPYFDEERLPQDWSVTTDSIAARLSAAIDADELILLKSCDPPPDADARQLAEQGYTDEHFGQVAVDQAIRWVNLTNGEEWWI